MGVDAAQEALDKCEAEHNPASGGRY